MITGQEISAAIEGIEGYFLGGMIGALISAFLVVAIIILIGIYVYTSLAWMVIAKRRKYKYPWLAWIPIANLSMIYQMGGFHWAWVFLILIPFIGWTAMLIIYLIATWRIFEKLKYPGLLALIPLLSLIPMVNGLASIAYLVVLGIIAWRKN